MRLLLTGRSGKIGSAIWRNLASTPSVEVVGVVRSEVRAQDQPIGSTVQCDLLDAEATRILLKEFRPDVVINAVGRTQGTAAELFADNVVTAINLVDALSVVAPKAHLIALGSAAEYGRPQSGRPIDESHECNPSTIYGHSKLAATRYLCARAEERGLNLSILRIFNLIGSANQVVGAFIERASALYNAPYPRIVRMGRLDAIRDFISLPVLVRFISALVRSGASTEIVNICSGEPRCVRDLVGYANKLAGNRFEILEEGELSSPRVLDQIIGDPTRFHAFMHQWGETEFDRSIFAEIEEVWRAAVTESNIASSWR